MGAAKFAIDLISAALSMVAPIEKARHPERATGGKLLLKCVQKAAMSGVEARPEAYGIIKKLFFDSMPSRCVEIERIGQVMRPRLLNQFAKCVSDHRCIVEAT